MMVVLLLLIHRRSRVYRLAGTHSQHYCLAKEISLGDY